MNQPSVDLSTLVLFLRSIIAMPDPSFRGVIN
jgi:hypothetical protein